MSNIVICSVSSSFSFLFCYSIQRKCENERRWFSMDKIMNSLKPHLNNQIGHKIDFWNIIVKNYTKDNCLLNSLIFIIIFYTISKRFFLFLKFRWICANSNIVTNSFVSNYLIAKPHSKSQKYLLSCSGKSDVFVSHSILIKHRYLWSRNTEFKVSVNVLSS